MDNLEAKLASLKLRCPSEGLDERVRSSKPEQAFEEQLKEPFLEPNRSTPRLDDKMKKSMFARMSPMMKAAAGLMLAAMLIGTIWAAEKIYMKWNGLSLTLMTSPKRSVTLPDGTTLDLGGLILEHEGGNIGPDVPEAVEAAKRHYEEMNKLIAEKNYTFLKTFKLFSQERYVYMFNLTDGTQTKVTVERPLETVTSWDDYQQKQKEQGEKIEKAVLAGNFRLIDVSTIDCWICRDLDSNEKLQVIRIYNPEGQDYAHATQEGSQGPSLMQEMTWHDHLKAIRDGKRELLGTKNEAVYTYEAVLEDGDKIIFTQDHPLKKMPTR